MNDQNSPQHARRHFLAQAGAATLGLSTSAAQAAASSLTTFRSPRVAPFIEELPTLRPAAAPDSLTLGNGTHSFHRDLSPSQVLRIGDQDYLGPTLEAHRGEATRIQFVNQLCHHPFARDIDTSIMGCSELDKTYPRASIHLHGGLTEPNSDGHPMASTRLGFSRRHHWANRQEASCMWYHDHALGLTRLNAFSGLAGFYLLRDDFDTGRTGNPLGLPTGEYEIPLVLQDRIFSKGDGQVMFRASTYVPQGQWEGGQFGDLPIVNGKVMPDCKVARGVYRFRLLNASNLRTYLLSFGNGMPLFVIGNDAGLLNAPVQSTQLLIAPGERYDVLVDFSALQPGETVTLRNSLRLPLQVRVFGDPVITDVMRFSVSGSTAKANTKVPQQLRGGNRLPALLPDLASPTVVRNMTINQLLDLKRFPPALMTLNNLPFDTTDIERPRAGTVELWNLINLTTDEHPIHIHLARLRVLGRQSFNRSAYQLQAKRPTVGMRWAPSPDKVLTGNAQAPQPWEAGFKDTVYAPPGMVTRVLVYWPTHEEMGFDPDAPIQVPDNLIAGAPASSTGMSGQGSGNAMNPGDVNALCVASPASSDGVLRLNPALQDSPRTVRGYVWHCHVLDHEDHDMMLPIRIS